jgi:hypothetical protein
MEPDQAAAPGPESTRSTLLRYGLIAQAGVGVQFDVTSVARRSGNQLVNGYLCDHNCTITYRGVLTGGQYNCPAAFSLNKAAIASSVAPADVILRGIGHVIDACRMENRRFVSAEFDDYSRTFGLPSFISDVIRKQILAENAEVTLFGGSPEAHPDILDLVSGLRAAGHSVHITMTGRRVMRSPALLRQLADSGLNVIALSMDDIGSVDELRGLLRLSPDELRERWRAIPRAHGQRQKVYEAVYTVRTLEALPGPQPALLLNIAVHPGNLATMDDFLSTLSGQLQPVALNPFPIQSAFEQRVTDFPDQYLGQLGQFVAEAIEEQCRGAAGRPQRWSLVPRLHYWLALQAALDGPAPASRMSGWETWRCFRSAGSGRYTQIAGSGQVVDETGSPGGRVGCFWNESLSAPEMPAVWIAEPGALADYLQSRPARAGASAHPCDGCLFPRLVGDMVSLETGLDPALRDRYRARRIAHLGF